MNAATQYESNALSLPERASVALGESANEAKLRELVTKSAGILTVTNADGREEAHRAGMVLLKTRTSLDKAADVALADAKAFVKAVGVKKTELIAIIQPEETRVMALRDAFDEQIKAEKQAKIAAERQRVESIQSDIASIRDTALSVAGKSSEIIGAAIDVLSEIHPTQVRFEEFADDAAKVIGDTMDKLLAMNESALAAEKAAADAEAARLAEVARMEAEKVAIAAQRAENERIAAEQAAEAKRLADAAAAQQAEQARVAAEAKRQMDAQQAEIAAAQRKLAEQQATADKRDADAAAAIKAAEAAALAKEQDAQRREDDHGPALEMNAAFDAEREAERMRLQALADQAAADHIETAADERACGLPVGALHDLADKLIDAELWPEDSELVSEIRHMFMREWGMDEAQADARMGRFDWAKAVGEVA